MKIGTADTVLNNIRYINRVRNLLNNKRLRDKQVEYMDIFSEKMLNNENPAKLVVNEIIKK